ncbi:MAG: ammonium transporter [Candidatus Methanoperedens sp.]|nr:ammonium transporter [Candidatus Methanoperedens sp.]
MCNRSITRCAALVAVIFSIMAIPALAGEVGAIDTGDTTWVLVCAPFVMLMIHASGTVVHITAGISALVVAIIICKRLEHGTDNMAQHNVPMSIIGGILLWFGWFGYTAAAAAALIWTIVSWKHCGKPVEEVIRLRTSERGNGAI